MSATHANSKLAKFALQLQGYDLTIKHRSGKTNLAADDLSRVEVQPNQTDRVDILSKVEPDTSNPIVTVDNAINLPKLQREDVSLTPLIEYLTTHVTYR